MRFLGESVKKLDNFRAKQSFLPFFLGKWGGSGIILSQ